MDEDIDLLDRVAQGDREAFSALVEKHQRQLYAFLYRMLSNHEDAADVLQKALVKAFTNLRTFERRSSFRTWLYQIAINLAKNVYRDRSKAEHIPIDDIVIAKPPRELDNLIAKESRKQMLHAVATLPEKQRITLLLRVQGDKKFEEIAEIMDCAVGTAKANYHHAVRKLKDALGDREPAGGAGNKDRP